MGIRILHCDDMYLSYKCFLILAFAPRRMAVSCVAARPSVCTENPVPRWDLWTYRGVSSLGSDATSRTAASASLTRSSKLRSHSIDGDSTSSPFVLALQNGCWTARLKCGWGDGDQSDFLGQLCYTAIMPRRRKSRRPILERFMPIRASDFCNENLGDYFCDYPPPFAWPFMQKLRASRARGGDHKGPSSAPHPAFDCS